MSTASVPRVPECLFPRRNWDPPPPLPQTSEGWETNSDDWRKSLELCQLCGFFSHSGFIASEKVGKICIFQTLENSIRECRGGKTKVFVTNLLSFGDVAAVKNNTKRIILFPIKSATKRNHLSSC
jgi:hypothetical protein